MDKPGDVWIVDYLYQRLLYKPLARDQVHVQLHGCHRIALSVLSWHVSAAIKQHIDSIL